MLDRLTSWSNMPPLTPRTVIHSTCDFSEAADRRLSVATLPTTAAASGQLS